MRLPPRLSAGFAAFILSLSASSAVCAAANGLQTLALRGDVVAVAEVPGAGGSGRLAVITSDQAKPRPKRTLVWVKKQGGALQIDSEQALDADDSAFDVCRLRGPSAPAEVLTVRSEGVYRLGQKTPLATVDTIYAQPSDEMFPRVRLCFPVFAGEAPALVVPGLRDLHLFRSPDGASYQLKHRLPVTANANYSWTSTALRGEQLDTTQLIAVRFDYPAVTAFDFNGDGHPDLCLSRGEHLQCYLQEGSSFAETKQKSYFFPVRSDTERQQQSVRVIGQMVDLETGHLPSYVISKTEWNVSDMRSTVYIFRPLAGGGFGGKPAQTITRKGYFAYHEFLDLSGSGRKDLIAPVAALGWSDLMSIYLAKAADIDFVRYRNTGSGFASTPEVLHSLSFPVDFKRLSSVLGALPLWRVRLPAGQGPAGGQDVAFFPAKEAVDLVHFAAKDDGFSTTPVSHIPVAVGAEVLATDLDGDGVDELIFYSPHEPAQQKKLVVLDLKTPVAH